MAIEKKFHIKVPNDYPECEGCENRTIASLMALSDLGNQSRKTGIARGEVTCIKQGVESIYVRLMVSTDNKMEGRQNVFPAFKDVSLCPGRVERAR